MSEALKRLRAQMKEKAQKLQVDGGRTAIDDKNVARAGVVKTSSTQVDYIQKAKQGLSSAEEQLAKDKESGLFEMQGQISAEIPVDKFMQNFHDLRASQLAKTPDLPNLLNFINSNVRKYPELAHALTDEQLHIIVGVNLEVANVKQSNGQAKAATTKEVARKNSQISADDFF